MKERVPALNIFENPARKSLDYNYFGINNQVDGVIGRAKNPDSRQGFFSTINKSKKAIDLKHSINVGSPTLTNKKDKIKYSPLGSAYIKGRKRITYISEKVTSTSADLLIKPFFRQQVDYLKVGLGNFIARDKEVAKKSYGLMFPRIPFKMFGTLNYPTTWIEAATPMLIKEKIFDFRQRFNNVFLIPLGKLGRSIGKFSRKIESKLYSKKEYRRKLFDRNKKWGKFREKTRGRISRLENFINEKWQFKNTNKYFYKREIHHKRPSLTQKNQRFREKLNNAA